MKRSFLVHKPKALAIAWNGLPTYGAHLLQQARSALGYSFPIVATRSDLPVSGIREILPADLYWIEDNERTSWESFGLEVPRLFIHSGWRYRHFLCLADAVRSKGGRVVGMFDNSWKGSLRQKVGASAFRAFYRANYAAAWVPGSSGRVLARYMGFPARAIREGLYGANPLIFSSKTPIAERSKQFVFVGRLIDRKGFRELLAAFKVVRAEFPDWKLAIVGCGPLAGLIDRSAGVEYLPFSPPAVVSEVLNRSRVLILPSREDHWGLVVHEAALCGCGLLLTQAVGASSDLVGYSNGRVISRLTVDDIAKAMRGFCLLPDSGWDDLSRESVALAASFGPTRWSEELQSIVGQYAD